MSKELPYFRFYPSEWNEGSITLHDMITQGLFINICAWYWKKDSNITLSEIRHRLINGQAPLEQCLSKLIDSEILKVTKDGYFTIDFLDEQYGTLRVEREKKVRSGSLGGQASVKQRLNGGQAIKIDKDNDKYKDILKSEKEHLNTLMITFKIDNELLLFSLIFGQAPTPTPQNITPFNSPLTLRGETPKVLEFPFTVQAPLGEWDNPIFQDGCEEAAALMLQCAVGSVQCPVTNGDIDKNWAREQIIKMSDGPADTSAEDTAKKYLTNIKYQIINLESVEDLKSGIWIVPMDGRKLGNPYYTAPGPERHMILVIGFDPRTNEVITNDAGTKRGRGYRYNLDVFYNAIRDYPTGNHEPIITEVKTGILLSGLATE